MMNTTSTETKATELTVESPVRRLRWRATPTDTTPKAGKNEYAPIDWRITRRNFNHD